MLLWGSPLCVEWGSNPCVLSTHPLKGCSLTTRTSTHYPTYLWILCHPTNFYIRVPLPNIESRQCYNEEVVICDCMEWDLNPCGFRQQVLNLPPWPLGHPCIGGKPHFGPTRIRTEVLGVKVPRPNQLDYKTICRWCTSTTPMRGLEPLTLRLKAWRSANWATTVSNGEHISVTKGWGQTNLQIFTVAGTRTQSLPLRRRVHCPIVLQLYCPTQ